MKRNELLRDKTNKMSLTLIRPSCVKAKEKGLVRFIGLTGHHDPIIYPKTSN